MKILHVGKYYWPEKGGIENHLKILCEGLAAKGVSVRAVVSNTKNSLLREKINGVEIVRLPKAFSAFNQPIFSGLREEIGNYNPDMIHLHLPNPLAALKLYQTQKPIVITYHSDIVGKPAMKLIEFSTGQILKKARAVIATSENYVSGSKLLKKFKDKIKVIPLSVELKKMKPAKISEIKKMKQRLGIKNEFVILFVGRLIPYKGLQFLIEALPLLKGDFKLIIGGLGPLESKMRELAKSLSVQDKIIFFGEVNENYYSNLFSSADIFVLPSHLKSEAFGIVQMEAMAHGKPVVSCNISGSGVPWVNKSGVSGIVVEPENPSELAGAIQKLMDNPQLRKKLGAGGRARAEELFDSKKMVRSVLRVYEEVLKRKTA